MSSLLNQKHALAKLRAELEKRREKIYQYCKKLRHLTYNCRKKRKKEKGESISQNKFKVLASKVIRYEIRKEVVRRQEIVEKEEVRCFRYQRRGYYKWKCPDIEIERRQ